MRHRSFFPKPPNDTPAQQTPPLPPPPTPFYNIRLEGVLITFPLPLRFGPKLWVQEGHMSVRDRYGREEPVAMARRRGHHRPVTCLFFIVPSHTHSLAPGLPATLPSSGHHLPSAFLPIHTPDPISYQTSPFVAPHLNAPPPQAKCMKPIGRLPPLPLWYIREFWTGTKAHTTTLSTQRRPTTPRPQSPRRSARRPPDFRTIPVPRHHSPPAGLPRSPPSRICLRR